MPAAVFVYCACCVRYLQAIELLEAALELRHQLFSSSSFLYADTAALLAKTLIAQQKAAADAGGAAGGSSGTSDWFGRSSSSSSSSSGAGGKGGGPPDVVRAIKLWQTAVQIVEESGEGAAPQESQQQPRHRSHHLRGPATHTHKAFQVGC